MPQGGFSPLRLEGWRIRRDLPGTSCSLSLLPAYTDRHPVCLRPSCFSIDPPKVGSVDAMYCTARLLALLYGSDPSPSRRGLLLPGFQRDRPVAGYDYSSGWTPLLAGLSPTGTTTRLAAPQIRTLIRSRYRGAHPLTPSLRCASDARTQARR